MSQTMLPFSCRLPPLSFPPLTRLISLRYVLLLYCIAAAVDSSHYHEHSDSNVISSEALFAAKTHPKFSLVQLGKNEDIF